MSVKSEINITANDKGVKQTVDRVTRNFNQAERQIQGFGNGISGTLGSLSSLLNPTLAISAAIGGVVTGLGYMVKSTIDTAEHIEKMSQRVGISAESLSTLSYAAQLSGTDIGVFEKAVQRLSRNVDDAGRGIGDGKIAFEELGISVIDSSGSLRAAEAIMKEVADKFGNMEDGTKKTALALKIFGRAGADLIPMLNGGAEKLNAMQQEARNLGVEISTKTAKDAAEFKDEMLRLETAVKGVGYGITSDLLPALNDVTDWAYDNKEVFSGFIKNSIKEFRVLFAILDNPQLITRFLTDGFDMKIPQKEIKATKEELDNLKNGVSYVVDETGKLKKITILTDAEIAKRKLEDLTKTTDAQKKAAATLEKQWQATLLGLNRDVATAGLSKTGLEFAKIDQKVEDLYAKFGNKAVITEWAASMKVALIDVNSIPIKLEPSFDKSKTPKGLESVSYDTSFYDFEKARIKEVTDLELANLKLRQQAVSDMFGNMSQAAYTFYQTSGEQNRAAFNLYKGFAIAEAGIATYHSAINAFESLSSIPVVGPTLGYAAAAAATAFGMAQIHSIASMSPGSKASGSVGNYNPTSGNSNNYNNSNNQTQNVTVIIHSSAPDGDALVRDHVIPALEKHVKYGGRINISKGI